MAHRTKEEQKKADEKATGAYHTYGECVNEVVGCRISDQYRFLYLNLDIDKLDQNTHKYVDNLSNCIIRRMIALYVLHVQKSTVQMLYYDEQYRTHLRALNELIWVHRNILFRPLNKLLNNVVLQREYLNSLTLDPSDPSDPSDPLDPSDQLIINAYIEHKRQEFYNEMESIIRNVCGGDRPAIAILSTAIFNFLRHNNDRHITLRDIDAGCLNELSYKGIEPY